MNLFYRAVCGVLEVDDISPEADFRAMDGWCSLKAFGLLVLLENDWGAPLTIEKFSALKTARDLYREAFLAFAAGVFGVERAELRGETAYGSIPQWDSVAHLKLVMEAERRFGVSYELERLPGMKTLDDFLA